jgi:hypothetical protein
LLNGKRKVSFSLSLQINDLHHQSLIWAPRSGRVDDFLQSHQFSGQALQLATPHEVHVKVKYHLPPIGVTVDLNPISACGYTFFLGELTCLEGEPSQQLSLLRPGIVESRHVLLRNQEKVNRGFWVDVLKNQDLIVLVDHCRGNVT